VDRVHKAMDRWHFGPWWTSGDDNQRSSLEHGLPTLWGKKDYRLRRKRMARASGSSPRSELGSVVAELHRWRRGT
jgi:hypothetical protein